MASISWSGLQRGAAVVVFGYFVQAFTTLLSMGFSPYILRTIGPEAYGLAGVFLIALSWFQLLDAGLTPTLTRVTARYRGGATDASALRNTLKGLETIVLAAAVPVALLAHLASGPVAEHWFQRETIDAAQVAWSLGLMALVLLVRWASGLRRAVLAGFERHLLQNAILALVAILRFPCIVLYFWWVEPGPVAYFAYQLAVSLLEALLLWACSRSLLPRAKTLSMPACIRSLRSIAAFALDHGFAAVLWVLITQTDKMVLSRSLPLADFGYFSLAMAAAAGVSLIAMPIDQVLLPKLARLHAEGQQASLLQTYHRYSRAAVVFVGSTAVLFAFFGQELMLAWTGDAHIASRVGGVLGWYAVGNAAIALCMLPYYLLYASGDLKRYTRGSMALLALTVPVMLWAATEHGMIGASLAWAALGVLYLLTWVTLTHRQFLDGQHWRWLVDDVLRIIAPVVAIAYAFRMSVQLPEDRFGLALAIAGMAAALFAVALFVSGLARRGGGLTRAAAPSS